MSFIIIYVTHKNMEEARKVGDFLLQKRLIACANYIPITSSYLWKGKIENEKEIVSILKTRTKNWEKIKKEIEKIHPYETPCIIRLEASSNSSFEEWVTDSTA
jgi:periplasmic divalent cation tolerance protein